MAKAAKTARPKATKPAPRAAKAGKREAAKPRAAPAAAARDGAQAVDARIRDLPTWQADIMGRMRALIRQAVPDVVEEVKWRKPSNGMAGVATWSRDGLLCTGEPYKAYVKFTFAKGAALPDPKGLFNAGDKGATRRAIDVHEGEAVDAAAFKALVKAAAALDSG